MTLACRPSELAMPFIIQCPYQDCLKYMLLEDDMQGQSLACLVCNQEIHLGGPPAATQDEEEVVDLQAYERPDPRRPKEQEGGEESSWRFIVKKCPKCNTPLRIPPEKLRQAISCTECDFWGIIY